MTKSKPPKKRSRQREVFCQEIAKGSCGSDAAKAAGYKGKTMVALSVTASRLQKNPEVAARIRELLDKGAEKAQVTVEKVLRDLEEQRQKALAAGSHSAAVRASELQGKYLKMFTDRIEHVETIGDVSMDQLLALAADLGTRLKKEGHVDITRALEGAGSEDVVVSGPPRDSQPN